MSLFFIILDIMRDDPEFNIKFCEEMEKFPCLYDNTRSDYSNRAAQDQAWTKIGENLKERAANCKDRWKNIRGRYVKCKNQKNLPSGSRDKRIKDYYLTPHLHFLDSFLKSRKSKGNIVIKTPPKGGDIEHCMDEVEDVDSGKAEEEDSQGGDNESEINRSPTPSPFPEPKYMNPPPPPHSSDHSYRKRKGSTSLTDVNEQPFKYFEKKQNILQQTNIPQKSESPDPDMAFFQSLLPDMKCMDESKKRKFKMGILKLADQLLDPVTSD